MRPMTNDSGAPLRMNCIVTFVRSREDREVTRARMFIYTVHEETERPRRGGLLQDLLKHTALRIEQFSDRIK